MTGSVMAAETASIPAAASAALTRQTEQIAAISAQLRAFDPRGVVTVARGSSDHAAEFALRVVGTRLGRLGTSLPPSLLTVSDARIRFDRQLVLAISQSGRSPDVLHCTEVARRRGALTLALTNDAASPLAKTAELVLAADAGPEHAVAATKSYVLTLLQVTRLLAAWAQETSLASALAPLPGRLAAALATDVAAALEPLTAPPGLFVVGRGLAFATAREAALKFKEIAGIHAEAVSGAEIMHGPKALVGPDRPVLMVAAPDLPAEHDTECAHQLAALTERLIIVGARDLASRLQVRTPAAPDPLLQPLVDATAMFVLAEWLARRRGLDPDRPRHLQKVTETL